MKTKTKRAIAEGIGWTSWLMTIGVVGGMDCHRIGLRAGILWAFGTLCLGTLAMYKAGLFSARRIAAPSLVAAFTAGALIIVGALATALI